MGGSKGGVAGDKTEAERRKNLSNRQIKDLELAGGVEGGMQAGSAGGPGESDTGAASKRPPGQPRGRGNRSKD